MWIQASFPFGRSVATTPSQGPRCWAMLITRWSPNSVHELGRLSQPKQLMPGIWS